MRLEGLAKTCGGATVRGTVRDASKILVVKHGRVAESGTHQELLAMGPDGEYAKLVHRQMASRSGGSLEQLATLAGGEA